MRLDDLYHQTQSASGNPFAEEWRSAAQQDAAELERWLHGVPFSDCALFEIYEALAASSEPPVSLLSREFERLLAAAESEPKNTEIPAQLLAFTLLHGSAQFRERAIQSLSQKLGSASPQMRRLASSLLADFALAGDQSVIAHLRTLISHDSDFRVRYLSFCALRDIRLEDPRVSAPPPLAFTDRLRLVVLGGRSAGNTAA